MLYLWLDTLYQQTYFKLSGTHELGVIAKFGAQGFQEQMQNMNLEFPLIVYTHAIIGNINNTTCNDFF